jgi:hypothetical protein
MSSPSSPYKEVGMLGHEARRTHVGLRAKAFKTTSDDYHRLQLKGGTAHKWMTRVAHKGDSVSNRRTRGSFLPSNRMFLESNEPRVCKQCRQPEFAVFDKKCKGGAH